MQNDLKIIKHSLKEEENISDPYQVIAGFFDVYSIGSIRKRISAWMETVNKKEHWRELYPSNLSFFYEYLVKLIKAVHQIDRQSTAHKTAIDLLKGKGYKVETNLLHPALYFGWGRYENIWTDFPRNLSLEEYIDPYLVFPQFFGAYGPDEWYGELYELLSRALSGHYPADLSDRKKDVLLIQKNLLKLAESVHLIDIREIEYKGRFKKRYPFTLDKPCDDLPAPRILKIKLNEKNELRSLKDENPSKDEENGYDDKHDEADDGRDESYNDRGLNEESEDYQKGSREDILSKALNGNLQKVNITIRGNYIVNHPPAAGKAEG